MIGSDFLHEQYVNQAFEDPIENGVGSILKWKVNLKSKKSKCRIYLIFHVLQGGDFNINHISSCQDRLS